MRNIHVAASLTGSSPAGFAILPLRIAAKIGTPDKNGCMLWTGEQNHNGYGRITFGSQCNGTRVRHPAHRLIYVLLVGAIPAGLQLDHLCRVRLCVNPEHLEVVTPRQNTLRGVGITALNAVKTHCPKGHPYEPGNIYWKRDRRGRSCRTCTKERDSRRIYGHAPAGSGLTPRPEPANSSAVVTA